MTTAQSVAELIGQAIKAAERSTQWTADKSGIAGSTFRRKLAGGADFTLSEVGRIALALNVAPSSLLPDEFKAVA